MSTPKPAAATKPGALRRVLGCLRWTVLTVIVVIATIYLVRAFDSRRKPELEAWHTEAMPGEFRAEDSSEAVTLADYLAVEARVFDELDRFYDTIEGRPDLAFSRFNPGGPIDPRGFASDWNRTFELQPEAAPTGAALLIHGLTDSPYSMRRVGEILVEEGYYVLGLRLPGHGTTPGSLAEVHWKDWRAAVRIAAQHTATRAGDGPFLLVGYSAGGALAVDYSAEVLLGNGDPPADRLVLFSPAIGITRFAIVSSWHRLLSWHPYFERFAYQDIEPEFDPYKYNSFPKNGAEQMRALSLAVQKSLAKLAGPAVDGFPPTLAFQSLVDSTVLTSAITTHLFAVLGPSSELVLFDINREAALRPFFSSEQRGLLERLEEDPKRTYRLTVVTNRDEESAEIVAQTWPANETTPETIVLGARWPTGVYSLSHVAMPFPPEDPIYGQGAPSDDDPYPMRLGTLAPRGERGLLRVSVNRLMRLRYNPFFAYVDARLREE